jgi:hypothetical protein
MEMKMNKVEKKKLEEQNLQNKIRSLLSSSLQHFS